MSSIIVTADKKTTILPLLGKTFVIDPGHGGKDPGTSYKNYYEKDINLKISKYLEKELINQGAEVILTRENDYDLSSPSKHHRKKSDFDNRIKIINENKPTMYLSIHINYLTNPKYKGIQVFYLHNKEEAIKMQEELNKKLNSNREAKKMRNTYYMYEKLKVSGLLIECGFLSNPQERELLINSDYQKKIANAISESLVKLY